jgi:myb proto-oncogene protein
MITHHTMSNLWLKCCRQPGLYEESPASSEYSTGSTLLPYPAPDKTEQTQAEIGALHKDIEIEMQMVRIDEENFMGACGKEIISSADITQGNEFFMSDKVGQMYFCFLSRGD